MKMDIRWTLVLISLLYGSLTDGSAATTVSVTPTLPPDKSSPGEPTTQRQTETNPLTTVLTNVDSQTRPTKTPPITNPTGTTSITNPTGTTSITNPTGTTSITNPTGTTSITKPNGPPLKLNPTGLTLITKTIGPTLESSLSGVSQTSVEPTSQNLSGLTAGNPPTGASDPSERPPQNKKDPSESTSTTLNPDSRSAVSHSHQTSSITSKPSIKTPERVTVVFDLSKSSERNVLYEACKKLTPDIKGNCSVNVEIVGKQIFATVTIDASQPVPTELYKSSEQEDLIREKIPDTLIAILASCGALVLILCFFAAYCMYHRKSYKNHQQHLTEELQTVENGYHDNPTLEVMEVQPEMQKKPVLNGELNDSWIVPIDNLLKDDIPDEEDTHL